MPYIKEKDRKRLDPFINQLAEELKKITLEENYSEERRYPAAYAGPLNYIISRLIGDIMPDLRYWHLALVTGVLENVKQEFYRRVAAPYEDKQIEKNSDIPEYEYINSEIKKLK